MKLFSVKTLPVLTMLSTAILLSACDGSRSNSSGGGDNNTAKSDPAKAESNSSGSKKEKDKQKEQTKKDNYSLLGHWKSECITDLSSPTIVYYHITESNNKLKSEEVVQEFNNRNCTGKSEITNNGIFDLGTQKKPRINVEFVNKDTFLHLQNDEATNNKTEKTKFTRSPADEFNKIKNQAKQDQLPTKKTIIDKLDGYWKSKCTTEGRFEDNYKSTIMYMHFQKVDNNHIKISGKSKDFTTKNCTGNFVVKKDDDTLTLTKTELESAKDFKLIDDNHWKDTNDNQDFIRIKESEFNSVK